MAEPTLLIPGTQATKLRETLTGTHVYNAARAGLPLFDLGPKDLGNRTPAAVRKLLSMEHEPGQLAPKETSLEAGNSIVADEVTKEPYKRVRRDDDWPYDWRADLRYNATLLLDELRRRTDGGTKKRWNLIGHSQGGLVIALASMLAESPREFASMVGRVALVGVPFAGTVRATDALVFGRGDLGKANIKAVVQASRSWPALLQMMPAWNALLRENGDPRRRPRQLVFPAGWDEKVPPIGVPEPSDDLLERVRDVHRMLSGPFSHMAGVHVLTLFGMEQPTPFHVPQKDAVFSDDYERVRGDGLVPWDETNDRMGPDDHDTRLVLQDAKAHAWLCSDREVLDLIEDFFHKPLKPAPAI